MDSTSSQRQNDVGGTLGRGAIVREPDEPPFHHEWEARVFALNRVLLERRIYTLDEFRYALERIAPERYGALSYYERWLEGIEMLVREKGVLA